MSTPISTPSVVEVHVNGRLVRQEQVQPGRLDLRNLPLTTGHNDTRVVVRDAFGGTRELATSYYLDDVGARARHARLPVQPRMAPKELRRPRASTTVAGADARHRVGLTDWLTAGLRARSGARPGERGPLVNLRLPFGEVEAAPASAAPRARWARRGRRPISTAAVR